MQKKVICIGSVLIDEIYISKNQILSGTSNPASMNRQVGGVIANIARHLSKLGLNVELITAFGNDGDADYLRQILSADRVLLQQSVLTHLPTGKYVGVLSPNGALYTAVVTDTIEEVITPAVLEKMSGCLSAGDIIIADCNLNVASLQWLIHYCRHADLKLIIEPVSVPKAKKMAELELAGVFLITPNEDELKVLVPGNAENELLNIRHLTEKGVKHVWLRKGAAGSLFFDDTLHAIQLDAVPLQVLDATGAGDAALAAWVAAYLDGNDLEQSMKAGHALAYEVLQQVGAVIESLDEQKMKEWILKYEYDAN